MSETMRLKDISETELELFICRKLLGIVEVTIGNFKLGQLEKGNCGIDIENYWYLGKKYKKG